MSTLTGNEKRKASCKAVGSEKKLGGHKKEVRFRNRWGDPTAKTTQKAEADEVITNEELQNKLNIAIGPLINFNTTLKSGNIQMVLGNIPEITGVEDKLAAMSRRTLYEKYLGKSESARRAGVMCYNTGISWLFFNVEDVIDFIVAHATWRLLPSGRIKGDFADSSNKGSRQYLTYEYRPKKGHFLGANGPDGGKKFIALLKANLRSVDMADTQ